MIDRSEPVTGVLVGVDGNPATLRAVGWAAREAERRGLSVDLVQVLPPSEHGVTLRAPSGRAHALLDQARHVVTTTAPDVDVRLSVVDGTVGSALVEVAARAALVVLRAHSAQGDLDLTVGRTVGHILGHAACPVVVVPQRWDPEQPHDGEVLVGVDGSPEAVGAVAFAADAADRWGSGLVTVAVAPRHGAEADEDTQRRLLAEAVAGVAERYPDVPVRHTVAWGTPSQEIVGEARERAGLVVLGSRGRGAFAGAVLGSTSQAVVRLAPCPVAVLPPRAAEAWTVDPSGSAGAAS